MDSSAVEEGFDLGEKLIQLGEANETKDIQPATQVRAVGISEFLKMDIPARENLLNPWLPTQGICMIYGERGIGKTHVAIGISLAVASAEKILNWESKESNGVLYLDGEMPAVVLQNLFAESITNLDKEPIAPIKVITPDLQTLWMPNLSTTKGQEGIEPYLEDISLIIVDNISTLCAGGRENDAESWIPIQEWALKMRSKGKSVLFIHHSGKGGLQRGTSKREDVLDTVIKLKHPNNYKPEEGACFEVHFEKSRGIYGDDVKPFEAKLMTDQNGKQVWTMKNLEESLTEKVANLLNDGVEQKEIPETLGVSKGTVSKHKKKAENQGLLQ